MKPLPILVPCAWGLVAALTAFVLLSAGCGPRRVYYSTPYAAPPVVVVHHYGYPGPTVVHVHHYGYGGGSTVVVHHYHR